MLNPHKMGTIFYRFALEFCSIVVLSVEHERMQAIKVLTNIAQMFENELNIFN